MMNDLRINYSFPLQFFNLWGTVRYCVASLYHLFQRTLFSDRVPSSLALSQRYIKIGSVENGGNTCILSVLLQEIAALPDFYDHFLTGPLKQGIAECEEHFELRTELQSLLNCSVNAMRLGKTVSKKDIQQLTRRFLQLGWLQESAPIWRLKLHQWAPSFFSLPLSNPFHIYDQLISLYPEALNSSSIALLARTSSIAHDQIFKRSPFIDDQQNILWRVAEDSTVEIELKESFQIHQRLFALKIVHVRENQGMHVVVYRKEGDDWICCDDAKVYPVESLPSSNIYAVVYESHDVCDQNGDNRFI